MIHPDTNELTLLLDDELTASARQRIEVHLAICDVCRASLANLAQINEAVRAALPTHCQAACEEDFWGRLLPALVSPAKDVWSWLSLAPALALAAALAILGGSVNALRAMGGLQRTGVVADWDQSIAEWIPAGLNSPLLERAVYDNLGWSGQIVSAKVSTVWQAANQVTHDTTTELLILLVICLLGMATIVLGLFWVVCWAWSSSGQSGKGRF
jgi:anti-sigma factor RsiW